MITLLPNTSVQEFNIIPRNPDLLSGISLTITEEGTSVTETFADVTAFENGDFICISQAFTILKEDRIYEVIITQDGENWWRGKLRCTSQVDEKVKLSLNTVADDDYQILSSNTNYTILP